MEILDVLVLGAGPAGTGAAFRAQELGLSVQVIDNDDVLKRIRDYAKDKLILPDFGGASELDFPDGGDLIARLRFDPIDKDDLCQRWKSLYQKFNVPIKIGFEAVKISPSGELWNVVAQNLRTQKKVVFSVRTIVAAMGKTATRRLSIPGDISGIACQLSDPRDYVGGSACVIGGGTSAAEAVIAISNKKAATGDASAVYWSYRREKMPKVSKALSQAFFEAFVGNGNIQYLPNSEAVAVVKTSESREVLSIRVGPKPASERPDAATYFEFSKKMCLACIGQETPNDVLKKMGIEQVASGESGKKRLVVTPSMESAQKNIFIVGDLLSPAYFETDAFDGQLTNLRKIKHRGNIKRALLDGVYAAEQIHQRLARQTQNRTVTATVSQIVHKNSTPISEPDNRESDSVEEDLRQTPAASTETEAWLALFSKEGLEDRRIHLPENAVVTVGKQDCDLSFPDDPSLSPQDRITFIRRPEGVYLRDDGCQAGVFLRLSPGFEATLKSGDVLRAGQQLFAVQNGVDQPALLHYSEGSRNLRRIPLSLDATIIGREHLDIIGGAEDLSLSRRHVSVALKSEKVVIRDLESANGSYLKINGLVKISNDDEVRLGKQALKLYLQSGKSTIPSVLKTEIQSPPKSQDLSTNARTANPLVSSKNGKSPQLTNPASSEIILSGQEGGGATQNTVEFSPQGKICPFKPGQTICEIAEKNGVTLSADCRAGQCGSDLIRILKGRENLNAPGDEESETLEDVCEREPGEFRLACMARPQGAVTVEIV